MERVQVENKILATLMQNPRGRILFVDDFLEYGNHESVKKALHRLKEKEILVRLAHGIYLYPKTDNDFGILYPSTEEIAQAVARRDRVRLVPTGIYALNKLGLSTQIPMKVVYLTDGAARIINIGKRSITFKKTSPKNLLAKGEISSLVIQALKTVGIKQADEAFVKKIQELLKNEKQENIIHDARLSPAWINKIMMETVR
jgi:hypothetical protein